MSLDGLRAWIGEVERKLDMRTRVFIVLVAIAVGGAGAAVYLAIDAQDNSVSKSDLEAVRNERAESPGAPGDIAQLEAEVRTLQAEVAALSASESGGAGKGTSGTPSESTGGVTPGNASGGAAAPGNQKPIQEAIEQAEEEAKK